MKFRLKFINSVGQIVRELNIEADDDDAATDYISNQSIYFNMAVELWRADEFVVRMTPMTRDFIFQPKACRTSSQALARGS